MSPTILLPPSFLGKRNCCKTTCTLCLNFVAQHCWSRETTTNLIFLVYYNLTHPFFPPQSFQRYTAWPQAIAQPYRLHSSILFQELPHFPTCFNTVPLLLCFLRALGFFACFLSPVYGPDNILDSTGSQSAAS